MPREGHSLLQQIGRQELFPFAACLFEVDFGCELHPDTVPVPGWRIPSVHRWLLS